MLQQKIYQRRVKNVLLYRIIRVKNMNRILKRRKLSYQKQQIKEESVLTNQARSKHCFKKNTIRKWYQKAARKH